MAAATSIALFSAALAPARLPSASKSRTTAPRSTAATMSPSVKAMAAPMTSFVIAEKDACDIPAVAVLEQEPEATVPTPVLPSGAMMAEFLTHYRSLLEHTALTGDSAADDIHFVLERVRVGTEGLLHHPKHGASPLAGEQWHKAEMRLEQCMKELEKDENMMRAYHGRTPNRLAVQLVGEHCSTAADILAKL